MTGESARDETTEGIRVGGPPDKVRASLCLYADDLDPESVTKRIGVPPTTSHRKGEPFGRKQLPRRSGAWILETEVLAPAAGQEALDALLSTLPDDPSVWADLGARHEVVIVVGVFLKAWNRGFCISRATVARLASMGAELTVDIYAG
jgi:hypothetical protein